MSVEENKAAARRFFEDVWTRGDVTQTSNFLAENFVAHNAFDIKIAGPDEYSRVVTAYREGFPDLVSTVEDVLAEGDLVAVRGTDRGTHRGEFMGHLPTGRTVTTTWIVIYRMEGAKAAEGWLETDAKRLLEQVGEPPDPSSS